MTDCVLALDLGTSSVKALVIDGAGAVHGSASAGYPVSRPRPGWAEQDPEAWWRAAVAATREAVAVAGAAVRVTGIGLSGQMHGTVLLGANDAPLGPAIIWEDQRSWRQVAEITALVGAARLVEIAGSPVATGFQAATVRWLQQEDRQRWDQTRRVLTPGAELRRRLTGEIATDPSDGSGTLLLDVRRRDWSDELLDALEIARDPLPPVRPAAAVAGVLQPAAASALGLPAGIPVATGGGDAACGLLGAGIVEPGTMLLSLSTGAQVMVPAATVDPDPQGRTHAFCAALEPGPDRPGWYQMGATLAAGLAMRWLGAEVFALGVDADAQMAALAAAAPPGADGLLFLPYLVGERSPHMDPRARGAFLGLTAGHGRAALARATLEGVTLAARDAFATLAERGARPTRIVIAGGGARGDLWRGVAADVFGLPVHLLATADQAAMGAAVLATAAAAGADPVATARTWATAGPAIEPDPARHARYDELFAIFREAYAGATATAHRLAAFSDRPPATG